MMEEKDHSAPDVAIHNIFYVFLAAVILFAGSFCLQQVWLYFFADDEMVHVTLSSIVIGFFLFTAFAAVVSWGCTSLGARFSDTERSYCAYGFVICSGAGAFCLGGGCILASIFAVLKAILLAVPLALGLKIASQFHCSQSKGG